ncbi:MAG: UDP-N-acetylmuramate dehydrogenase [Coriobacteriia bacterium]|nr:UDP-N-acetylmuramate dehydrogenase [Coriobacteriia bacterium]
MPLTEALARLKSTIAGDVRAAEPMARHTTYRVGGPAAIHVQLDTVADVTTALAVLGEEGVPWTVVGKGSNLLVSDSGYEGAVLVLGREFKRHTVDDGLLKAGAATVLGVLVQEGFHHGLTGLSWAVGIPGTLGGALAMNAGTRNGSIGETVDTVTLLVPGEGLTLVRGRDVGWAYRTSGLSGRGIILEAVLRVGEGDAVRIRAEMERYLKERKAAQPLGMPSAGSVFVNPEGLSAGRLIESAGCKGMRLGGAQVSQVHANFIVNAGGATARDIVGLIRKVQMTVRDTHGVELRPEIRFLGRFDEA